jgi:hypothetical protein
MREAGLNYFEEIGGACRAGDFGKASQLLTEVRGEVDFYPLLFHSLAEASCYGGQQGWRCAMLEVATHSPSVGMMQ